MITEESVLNAKVIAEEDQIARQFASQVSALKAQTDLMLQMCAWLFSGNADAAHLASVTEKFQAKAPILFTDIIPKLQAIEACGDPVDGAANLQAMITAYGLDPATFPNRYK